MLLEQIHEPKDLKDLNAEQLTVLAEEIRQELITTVSRTGGHLASNLGIVELTLAIHRSFNAPADKLIFDVGHQCYVHKMITGRFEKFHTLRSYQGICGFPLRSESAYDCFEAGHASTAISAALGMARARDYRKDNYHVVAVVGDGALTGGMCYEALNDAGNSHTKLIVILNDNEMSIAQNVGALSAYLTRLRISSGWQDAKQKVRHLTKVPLVGRPFYHLLHGSKNILKSLLVKDEEIGFFEALGFQYYGPINGHDIASLEKTFLQAKNATGPCVIHVLTRKGQGYDQAEERPEKFHGTPPFYIETGDRLETPEFPSYGHVMANTLSDMCETDSRIVAITAAMKLGTGLDHFEEMHPDRLIDVGIAEEHAVTMAAGLAAGGMRAFVAIYASFFQRAYDQMINDVCIQNLPVTFLLDRSGIGGEDGQTHHGLFDLAAVLPVPGITVLAPCDATELEKMVRWTVSQNGPVVIRYPKGGQMKRQESRIYTSPIEKWVPLAEGKDGYILAVGSMTDAALETRKLLLQQGIQMSVIHCGCLKPADEEFLSLLKKDDVCVTMEEHMQTGGFGSFLTELCTEKGYCRPAHSFAVPDRFIPHGQHGMLLREAGLTPEIMAEKTASLLKTGKDRTE